MSNHDAEYNKMRQQSGAVVKMVDEVRSSVDDVVARVRQVSLDYLYANTEELDDIEATAKHGSEVLLGSGQFLVKDVNVSLQELSESIEKYRKMVMALLEPPPPSPMPQVTNGSYEADNGTHHDHLPSQPTVPRPEPKHNNVRLALIQAAEDLTELRILADELLYREIDKDIAAASRVAASKVPEESDDHKKARNEREERARKEEEERKRQEEERKRKEEDERRKREERERKEEEERKRKEEERKRKEKEERKRREEEERKKEEKRQREEEERRRKEAERKAEEERLRLEKERKLEEERLKREEEQRKIDELKKIEDEERRRKEAEQRAEEERLRLERERKLEEERLKREAEREEEERIRKEKERKEKELREEEQRKQDEERRIKEEEQRKLDEEKERLAAEKRRLEEEQNELLRREQERLRQEEEKRRLEQEQRRLEEQQRRLEEERVKREKQEEENRRKAEERRRREEEEMERRRKSDPKNWPFIVYELNEEDDKLGSGIACIVRTCPEKVSLKKEQLQCTSVDWRVNRYPLEDNEELVCNMICLRPTDEVELELEVPDDKSDFIYRTAWIALPFAAVPRDREVIIRVQLARPTTSSSPDRKVVIQEDDGKTADVVEPTIEWSDVTTRETTIQGLDNVRFVETPVKRIDGGGINLVAVTRQKRDLVEWNERGGRIVSSVDPLVSITVPKNAFKNTTKVSLQVIIIDSAVIYGLKERYNGCDMLLGASPIVCVNASSQPLKPLSMSVTNPPDGTKKSDKSLRGTKNDDTDGVIQLMIKDTSGRWRHRSNVKLERQHDCVVFKLDEVFRRVLLLRTPPAVDSDELCLMTNCLEASLIERPAQLVVRQRDDDPSSVFVELCRRDVVDRLINGERLRSLGYTEGPSPSRLICLREGDLVEMSFRDNIEPVDISADGKEIPSAEPVRRFVFNSNMASINTELTVKEKSRFVQNTLEEYRGFVRLSLVERPYVPPPRVTGPYGVTADGAAKKTTPQVAATGKTTTQDEHLVCEVVLNLPKLPKQKGYTKINKMDFEILQNGPLTSEYYDQLSGRLGDEWVRLAESLGLGQPAIHRIVRNHAHLDDSSEITRRSAREMLIQWHRSSVKFPGKVDVLIQALMGVGRRDLAAELNAENNEYRRKFDQKYEEERLKKAKKIFVESVAAVRDWRDVGWELGLSANDLEAIGGPVAEVKRPLTAKSKNVVVGNMTEMRQHAEEMLNKWIELNGEEATTDVLIAALKRRKLNDTAALAGVRVTKLIMGLMTAVNTKPETASWVTSLHRSVKQKHSLMAAIRTGYIFVLALVPVTLISSFCCRFCRPQ